MAARGYFASRCKARVVPVNNVIALRRARRKIVARRHCGAGPLAANVASQEGRLRGPFRTESLGTIPARLTPRPSYRTRSATTMKRPTSCGTSCIRTAAWIVSMLRSRKSSLKSPSPDDSEITSMPTVAQCVVGRRWNRRRARNRAGAVWREIRWLQDVRRPVRRTIACPAEPCRATTWSRCPRLPPRHRRQRRNGRRDRAGRPSREAAQQFFARTLAKAPGHVLPYRTRWRDGRCTPD